MKWEELRHVYLRPNYEAELALSNGSEWDTPANMKRDIKKYKSEVDTLDRNFWAKYEDSPYSAAKLPQADWPPELYEQWRAQQSEQDELTEMLKEIHRLRRPTT